jgi:hypothetical protein
VFTNFAFSNGGTTLQVLADFILMIPMVIPERIVDTSGEIPWKSAKKNPHEMHHFNPFSTGEIHHFPMVSIGVPSGKLT